MTTEKQAYNALKNLVLRDGHEVMFQRVENMAGAGTPDVNFRSRGAEGWIETKIGIFSNLKSHVRVPRHKLLPSQRAWLERYTALDGTAYVHVYLGTAPRIHRHFLLQYTPGCGLYDRLGDGIPIVDLEIDRRPVWLILWGGERRGPPTGKLTDG